MAADLPEPDEHPAPRRSDAVGTVLTVVTAVVLMVGVLVIRSTRLERSDPPVTPRNETAGEVASTEEPKDPRPGVVLAWPKSRTETR